MLDRSVTVFSSVDCSGRLPVVEATSRHWVQTESRRNDGLSGDRRRAHEVRAESDTVGTRHAEGGGLEEKFCAPAEPPVK